MNTKYKTSAEALPRALGRPVGSLPLGPRSAVPPASRRANSTEGRIFKRTLSAGSIAPPSANKIRLEAVSANIKRLSGRKRPQAGSEKWDIKCIDKGDTAVSNAVRSNSSSQRKTGLTTNDILKLCLEEDPGKVFEIDLHGKEVTSTPDLEKFHKLRILDLSGNYIKKISGLGSKKDLKELKLYDNDITVIDGLDNLKELCSLQLQHNKISAIGRGLCNLKKLQCLRLDNNQISKLEIPELLSCSNITSLDLSHNRLESLAPLSYLPNLGELFASGNRIKKTGDLTKCKKLQEVDLARNQISDLSGLANLPNLQILDVSHNRIKTMNSVSKLSMFHYLDAASTIIGISTDWTSYFIRKWMGIKKIYTLDTSIRGLPAFLGSLEELNINSNNVEELSCIPSLFPSLQVLLACDNKISSWDEICCLCECVELAELYVAGNPFTMDDGEMPEYHHIITQELHGLEVIDGVTLKKFDVKQDGAPLMRPMSASSVISVRQLDSQLKAASDEQGTILESITKRFDALRMLINSLPSELARPQVAVSADTSTRPQTADSADTLARPQTADSADTSTSSRCNSRSRLQEAKNFAAMNFHDDEGGGPHF